ncbi:unnamed protein product [Lupinus luteus]|uniref:Uncharacterized protein n=1 Tax=Lupinus luteus TaxID=3873 RepID=A0AAV1XYL1_LUPLU
MGNKNVALLVVCIIILATLQPSTATLKEEWDSCYNKCCEGCTSNWIYYPCIGVCKTKCVPNLNLYQTPYSLASSVHGHGYGSRKHAHDLPPISSPSPILSPTSKN